MSSEPYLIAHKVRSEAAFDIATQMSCPLCAAEGCFECDEVGYWWIIPTSGHRAYPYWWIGLHELPDLELLFTNAAPYDPRYQWPEPWPDHYPTAATPSRAADFARILGLESKSTTGIRRR